MNCGRSLLTKIKYKYIRFCIPFLHKVYCMFLKCIQELIRTHINIYFHRTQHIRFWHTSFLSDISNIDRAAVNVEINMPRIYKKSILKII